MLHLVRIQEVRWDRDGTEPAGKYMVMRIISAVGRVETVGEKMSYILLRSRWCHSNVMNVHAPTENKTDDVKDSF
jgi:hypothetical protein